MNAIVILAAGSSSRMGYPKQNLVYQGFTFLQHAVRLACSVSPHVLVTLGANRDEIRITIDKEDVTILDNADWTEGMASSIRMATEYLQSLDTDIDSITFMLCDQPFVSADLLSRIIGTAAQTHKGIIACSYRNAIGVPVLFKPLYFDDLLMLKGDEGAKILLGRFSEDVRALPFFRGEIDIDTEEDYHRLLIELHRNRN